MGLLSVIWLPFCDVAGAALKKQLEHDVVAIIIMITIIMGVYYLLLT